MKLATWNVNSLRARMPRVLELLAKHEPDVVLLQETKVAPETFPADQLTAAGYESCHHSAGQWAGVAVLARTGLGLHCVQSGLPGEARAEEARWIEADVAELGLRVASVYVVNGRALDDPVFDDKLRFLDALAERARELAAGLLVIGGDFNVAPADEDVYDPAAFAGSTHTSAGERARLSEILAAGSLVDAYRAAEPERPQFTWWDYRQGHFHRGLGMRIDLLLASAALHERIVACGIDRDLRKGSKPSDHAPLLLELAGD